MPNARLVIAAAAAVFTAGSIAVAAMEVADAAPPSIPLSAEPMSTTVSGGASAAAAPLSYYVRHKAWTQKGDCWCVPTAIQLSLRTFGVKDLTQAELAREMKTTNGDPICGTTGKNAMPVYNKYLSRKGYSSVWKDVNDPATLMKAVSYDVGVLHRAIPLGVWGDKASWIKSSGRFGHVISVRGYNKSTGKIRIWDPANRSYGGHHDVSVSNLAKAAQDYGMFYVRKG